VVAEFPPARPVKQDAATLAGQQQGGNAHGHAGTEHDDIEMMGFHRQSYRFGVTGITAPLR
jgi:hypothetical protein